MLQVIVRFRVVPWTTLESLGKTWIFATFCENDLSQPPIVGKISYKRSVSLYLYWLSSSVRDKLLVKRIILPKLSIRSSYRSDYQDSFSSTVVSALASRTSRSWSVRFIKSDMETVRCLTLLSVKPTPLYINWETQCF